LIVQRFGQILLRGAVLRIELRTAEQVVDAIGLAGMIG
jgi:hypothetical protein